jgi:hypothetical protein
MTATPPPHGHFEAMAWLLNELAPDRIALHEHQYSPAAFGSFVFVLDRGHKQVRFAWDGRDALLSLDFRENREGTWIHDASISIPNGEGLYAEIASQATGMLAT